jgi:glycosyltransferase involved in cell wall biosynthesis
MNATGNNERPATQPVPAVTVQIFEPFAGRHHTKYVALLLPTLVGLRASGAIERIVVSTSKMHLESTYFADRLARFRPQVEFDELAGDYHNAPGDQVTSALLDSVERIRPNFVIATSANNGALSLAARTLLRSPFKDRGIVSAGVIHNGFSTPVTSLRDRVRDAAHRFSRHFAPWSELYVVNPLLYDAIVRRSGSSKGLRLLPDPVEVRPPVDKATARTKLGIPVEGRYIGHVGQSDRRKAIPELLAAFRSANLPPSDRLLIMGNLHPPFKTLIEHSYTDLIAEQRLILIDRYLDADELHAANCASDVIAVTYYIDELSSNLLAATAARRPVIAGRSGYTGMMIETFGVGWPCDIFDPSDFTRAVREAIVASPDYQLSPAAEKLLQYHDPQNYANALLAQLYDQVGLPPPPVKTWQWASEATA